MSSIPVLFIDDDIIVVDKPAELLSVPGRGPDKQDSVTTRLAEEFSEVHIVHRLDMSTSGLMIFARNKAALKHLHKQFQNRVPKKVYQAVVAGQLTPSSGAINLPMRCDWPNRPMQMVCYEHGKKSLTRWQVIDQNTQQSRVLLFPVTGRSHQLRVHCYAMGHPILGDNLYHTEESLAASHRLLLHAQKLELFHPTTEQWLSFSSNPDF
jgi:tRNA pseudouridine32 synthase/23S rRNA pseudouridine746 synthase